MLKEDLYSLSNDELLKISLEKNNLGVATKRALKAQSILWESAGKPFNKTYIGSFNNGMFEDDGFGFGRTNTDLYDDFIDKQNDLESNKKL